VAVPGEVAGYWEAKEKYGNKAISWARLVAPSVKMCR
jgi:gamma-glutamyltranspeptidase